MEDQSKQAGIFVVSRAIVQFKEIKPVIISRVNYRGVGLKDPVVRSWLAQVDKFNNFSSCRADNPFCRKIAQFLPDLGKRSCPECSYRTGGMSYEVFNKIGQIIQENPGMDWKKVFKPEIKNFGVEGERVLYYPLDFSQLKFGEELVAACEEKKITPQGLPNSLLLEEFPYSASSKVPKNNHQAKWHILMSNKRDESFSRISFEKAVFLAAVISHLTGDQNLRLYCYGSTGQDFRTWKKWIGGISKEERGFIAGEVWKLARSAKITADHPVFSNGGEKPIPVQEPIQEVNSAPVSASPESEIPASSNKEIGHDPLPAQKPVQETASADSPDSSAVLGSDEGTSAVPLSNNVKTETLEKSPEPEKSPAIPISEPIQTVDPEPMSSSLELEIPASASSNEETGHPLPAQEPASADSFDSSVVFGRDSLSSQKEPAAISPLSVEETKSTILSSAPALTEKQVKLVAQGVEFGHPDGIYLAMIPLDLVDPNPEQARFDFEIKALEHMASTLSGGGKYAKNKQPIAVTERGERFFLIDGERRWRSAQMAGAELIFCLVFPEMTDVEVLIDNCLLNFCRENMNEYENALAFRHLMEKRGWNQSELAKNVGVHPVTVSNALKFFKVHDDLLCTVKDKKTSPGIIKHFGSFPLDKQLDLYGCCEAEIFSKGTKLDPGKFPRMLKKIAQRMKIKPIHAKDKRTRTYEEMVIGGLFLRIGGLKKELEEVRGITSEKLVASRNFNAEKVISQLIGLKEQIISEIERISSHHLN